MSGDVATGWHLMVVMGLLEDIERARQQGDYATAKTIFEDIATTLGWPLWSKVQTWVSAEDGDITGRAMRLACSRLALRHGLTLGDVMAMSVPAVWALVEQDKKAKAEKLLGQEAAGGAGHEVAESAGPDATVTDIAKNCFSGVKAENSPNPPAKRPVDRAFIAWRLRDLKGLKGPTAIAAEMNRQRIKANQGQVSVWLQRVDLYLKAGNVFPDLPGLNKEPQSIDPEIIDMGPRQDGLTQRQRPRRDPDADSDDE